MPVGEKTKELWKNKNYRMHMSLVHKGKGVGSKNPFYGRRHSKEAIFKMRKARFSGIKKMLKNTGYVYLYTPDHPFAINGRVPEQIILAEQVLGRYLTKLETVHHINGVKTDNRKNNLIVCTRKYHLQLHAKIRGFGYIIKPQNIKRNLLTGRFYRPIT